MNALSADLRALVQQGALTVPQAAGIMHSNQQPPPANSAAADGHETKEEPEDRTQPPPPPKPSKVTRSLLVAFAREHLLRTQQFLSFLGMMPADDPLHAALHAALCAIKLPLSNFLFSADSACADPSSSSSGTGMEAEHPDEPPTHCLLYTSPSPRDATLSRMPSSA